MSNSLSSITVGCAVAGAALTGLYLLDQRGMPAEGAAELVAAIELPPHPLTGKTLTLTGSCARQQFMVPVYISSLYVEDAQKGLRQRAIDLLDDPSREKILALRWLQPMSKEELVDEFGAFFAGSDPDRSFEAAQQSAISQLIHHLAQHDVAEDDTLLIAWHPEGYLFAGFRGGDTFVIEDATLSTAAWSSLFMPSSPLNGRELVKEAQ